MAFVLIAKNLRKVYGSRKNSYLALNDISFNVEEGEFTAIMGPSGAGKTTLLNIISTIDYPTSGSVIVDGQNILKMNESQLSSFRRNKLGFIFQDFNLLDTLTAGENIVLPLSLSKTHENEIEKRLHKVSITLGIEDILDKYPYEISGGQKQRTAAARAVITDPSLVLADEPTGALDSRSSADLLNCLEELNGKNNTTILMVTHDTFAASYCKRILFIRDGSIYTEIFRNCPRKEFFQKILDVLKTLGGGHSDTF
jgi:putative ABC transport system ATP-binding protein